MPLRFLIVLIVLALSTPAEAQQAKKVPRIGYLTGTSLSGNTVMAFRRGLRELGYIESKNIVIEWRSAEGNRDRHRPLAFELTQLKVDVIVTGGEDSTRAAKEATSAIPIVMTNDRDPVSNGFVASLAHPGSNITGLSTVSPELSGKRLELLKEIVPRLSRVAVFGTSNQASNSQELREIERVAGVFGIKVQYLDVLGPKDIETSFRAAVKGRAAAILFQVAGPIADSQRSQIAALAVNSRLPVMYELQSNMEAGGLMRYGVNRNDLSRRAATYVDKILKGAKPADLPVEQPTKFEFIINLKAAKQIGLTIPPNVLARADKVIK